MILIAPSRLEGVYCDVAVAVGAELCAHIPFGLGGGVCRAVFGEADPFLAAAAG